MHLLLALYWLAAPLAPLNPVEQDTLPAAAVHANFGVAVGNGVISTGPTFSIQYEQLAVHPIIVRGGVELRTGSAAMRIWPEGDTGTPSLIRGSCRSMALGIDVFYYRGTNRLTAYLGVGVLYSFSHFSPDFASISPLRAKYGIDEVSVQRQFGYRLLLGLRFRKVYSFEIEVTELRPEVRFSGRLSPTQYFSGSNETRLGTFGFSLGRSWSL
jgi:hypothetical protein